MHVLFNETFSLVEKVQGNNPNLDFFFNYVFFLEIRSLPFPVICRMFSEVSFTLFSFYSLILHMLIFTDHKNCLPPHLSELKSLPCSTGSHCWSL